MDSIRAIHHIKQYIQDYQFVKLASDHKTYHAGLGITIHSMVKPEHMRGMPAYDDLWLKLCQSLQSQRWYGAYSSPLDVLSGAQATNLLFRNIPGQIMVLEAPLPMTDGEYARNLAREGLHVLRAAGESGNGPDLPLRVKESLTHIPDRLSDLEPLESKALYDAFGLLLGLLPDASFAHKYQIEPSLIQELTEMFHHLEFLGYASMPIELPRFSPVEVSVRLVKYEFPDGIFSPDIVWDSGAGIHGRADIDDYLAGFSPERLDLLEKALDEMASLARNNLPQIREYHLNQLRQQADSAWECDEPFLGLFPDGSWQYIIESGTDFPITDNPECPLWISNGKKQYSFEMKDVGRDAAGRDVLATLIVGGQATDIQRASFALLTALEASPSYQSLPTEERPRLFAFSSTGRQPGCPIIACDMKWDEERIQNLFHTSEVAPALKA